MILWSHELTEVQVSKLKRVISEIHTCVVYNGDYKSFLLGLYLPASQLTLNIIRNSRRMPNMITNELLLQQAAAATPSKQPLCIDSDKTGSIKENHRMGRECSLCFVSWS